MNQWIMGNPAQKRDCVNTNYTISAHLPFVVTIEVFIILLTVFTCGTKRFCSLLLRGLQIKLSIHQSDIWRVKGGNISTRNCCVF
jgi:hypothetical protein